MHKLNCAFSTEMRDLFLDGLPTLDALEIGASTAIAAQWLNCDQSSISRIYRRASEQLGLNFQKIDGYYTATDNQLLLQSLRRASQQHRLSSDARSLQWLLHPSLPLQQRAAALRLPLHCAWPEPQRLLDLLTRRVIDLAVVPQPPRLEALQSSGLVSIALAPPERRAPGPVAVLLRELQQHGAMQALLAQLTPAVPLDLAPPLPT